MVSGRPETTEGATTDPLLAPAASACHRKTSRAEDGALQVLPSRLVVPIDELEARAARPRKPLELETAGGGVASHPPAAPPAAAGMSHPGSLSRLTDGGRRIDMMRWLLRKGIEKFERDWNYDASYMRDMVDASPRAAWLFARAAALGRFRRDIPIEAWCAAGITAVRHEDCGPCTQLGVTMAERAGVSPAILRAVLGDNTDAMPPDVALVWRFTRATLAHDPAADEYREVIVKRWAAEPS